MWWALAAAAAVTLTILAVMPHALVGVFYDDGVYLGLAKGLAEGHGYRHLWLPGAPGAVHYPVLYPALLATLWKVWPAFPANVVLMRAANAVLMGGFAGLAAWYLGRRLQLPPWAVALVVAASATAVPVLAVATVLFSEPLFLALTVVACLLADAAREGTGGASLGMAAAAGVLAGLAALTRSIGVAVIAGVVLGPLLARRWRHALVALVAGAVCLVPWVAWVAAHRHGIDPAIAANYGTYGDFLTEGGVSWLSLRGALDLARPLGVITLGFLPVPLRALVGVAAGVVLVGGLEVLVRRAPAAGWMLIVYLGIVFLWPYGPDRFLWGILPWLGAAFAAGTVSLAARWPGAFGRALRFAVVVVAVLVGGGFAVEQVRGFATGAATSEQTGISGTMDTALAWIRSATDTSAIVAGEDEALIWLYTGRRAVPSYLWRVRGRSAESRGPDSLQAWLRRSRATDLVLAGRGSDAAPTVDALLGRYPGYLHLVYVAGPVMGFRVAGAP